MNEDDFDWAELKWRPKSWVSDFRILITRTKHKTQTKGLTAADFLQQWGITRVEREQARCVV